MKNKVLILVIALVVIMNVVVLVQLVRRQGVSISSGPVSSYILGITQPVYSVQGTVTSVNAGNKSFVMNIVQSSVSTPQDTQETKTFTLNVNAEKATITSAGTNIVPYAFKETSGSPANAQLSINDIKEGALVTVSVADDLRTAKSNTLAANSVQVSAPGTVVNGTVESINGSQIVVKGVVLSNSPTAQMAEEQKSYTIGITSETELSEFTSNGNYRRVSVGDIQNGEAISVYFTETNGQLQALLIRPITAITLPASPNLTPPSQPDTTSPNEPVVNPGTQSGATQENP